MSLNFSTSPSKRAFPHRRLRFRASRERRLSVRDKEDTSLIQEQWRASLLRLGLLWPWASWALSVLPRPPPHWVVRPSCTFAVARRSPSRRLHCVDACLHGCGLIWLVASGTCILFTTQCAHELQVGILTAGGLAPCLSSAIGYSSLPCACNHCISRILFPCWRRRKLTRICWMENLRANVIVRMCLLSVHL